MPELVPVRVRDCACPDSPHADGDVVYLLPNLPMRGGVIAERQLIGNLESGGDGDRLTADWMDTFVKYGAVGWNLLDQEGQPEPFDVSVVMSDWRLARPVADKASDLYAESVMDPFPALRNARSPNTPTSEPTSRPRRSRTRSSSS